MLDCFIDFPDREPVGKIDSGTGYTEMRFILVFDKPPAVLYFFCHILLIVSIPDTNDTLKAPIRFASKPK